MRSCEIGNYLVFYMVTNVWCVSAYSTVVLLVDAVILWNTHQTPFFYQTILGISSVVI